MTCRELFSGFCSTRTKARPLLFAWRALSDGLSSRVAVGEEMFNAKLFEVVTRHYGISSQAQHGVNFGSARRQK
jgi:hypothetical protein